MDWNAQLTSPEVEKAVQFYVDTGARVRRTRRGDKRIRRVRDAVLPGSGRHVVRRHLRGVDGRGPQVRQLWSARSATRWLRRSRRTNSGWLYTWSLGIPKSSDKQDAAWKFISWMTDKNYIKLVGEELGWERVPPGSRLSTYQIPRVQGGVGGVRAADTRLDRGRQPVEADRAAGALHRRPVPGHPGVPGSRARGSASRSARRSPARSRSRTRWNSPRNTPKSSVGPIRRSHDNHCPRLVGTLTPAPPNTLRGFGRLTTPTFLALRVGVGGDRCCRR